MYIVLTLTCMCYDVITQCLMHMTRHVQPILVLTRNAHHVLLPWGEGFHQCPCRQQHPHTPTVTELAGQVEGTQTSQIDHTHLHRASSAPQ